MSSLFCYAGMGSRYRQALSLPITAAGPGSPDTVKGRGDAVALCRHGTVIAPGAVSRYFQLWNGQESCWMAWLFSHLLGQRCGCVLRSGAMSLCYIPLPSTPGEYFLLSCVSRCSAGDLWKDVRKQKGPPARSRWPLISRREAAAYSPATAFWCSAMTLSATGWGASS